VATIAPEAAVPEIEDGAWLGSSNEAVQAPPLYYVVKRTLDIWIAFALLLITLPLLVAIAALIKLDSRGPILFTQERISLDRYFFGRGRPRLRRFRMLKFRTMRADADSALHEAHIRDFVNGQLPATAAASSVTFKLANDPRITRVGRYLRRTSLDELPQLVNVLLGDMSLVGPRPLPVYEVALYDGDSRGRFLAHPGITGLWQVSGRCDLSFAQMIALDLEYVRTRSVALDLRILVRTIPAVLRGRGAA
jgi:lipopolysaccharide/colanic/teichoic acid biosynthesis glycosyltransferase